MVGDGTESKATAATDILDRLVSEEAKSILHRLLDKHPELRPETEKIAQEVVSSQSVEDIAAKVLSAVTGVDLEALNGRAGKHSWGYVEPSEAAWELLDEAMEEWVEDLKRQVELELMPAAENVCVGIVTGLHRAQKTDSDGGLGWAVDFPAEKAGCVVQEFLELSGDRLKGADREKFIGTLIAHAPGWSAMFRRMTGCDSR